MPSVSTLPTTCPAAFSFFVKQMCPLKNAIYLEPVVIWQNPVGHEDNARGKLFKNRDVDSNFGLDKELVKIKKTAEGQKTSSMAQRVKTRHLSTGADICKPDPHVQHEFSRAGSAPSYMQHKPPRHDLELAFERTESAPPASAQASFGTFLPMISEGHTARAPTQRRSLGRSYSSGPGPGPEFRREGANEQRRNSSPMNAEAASAWGSLGLAIHESERGFTEHQWKSTAFGDSANAGNFGKPNALALAAASEASIEKHKDAGRVARLGSTPTSSKGDGRAAAGKVSASAPSQRRLGRSLSGPGNYVRAANEHERRDSSPINAKAASARGSLGSGFSDPHRGFTEHQDDGKTTNTSKPHAFAQISRAVATSAATLEKHKDADRLARLGSAPTSKDDRRAAAAKISAPSGLKTLATHRSSESRLTRQLVAFCEEERLKARLQSARAPSDTQIKRTSAPSRSQKTCPSSRRWLRMWVATVWTFVTTLLHQLCAFFTPDPHKPTRHECSTNPQSPTDPAAGTTARTRSQLCPSQLVSTRRQANCSSPIDDRKAAHTQRRPDAKNCQSQRQSQLSPSQLSPSQLSPSQLSPGKPSAVEKLWQISFLRSQK